ncbi:hypothetical protein [Pelagibaculum spongiae]|uniref:Uncharacterized protein n=1 Tax=Pelagibaculum spongiae TaxID=2080658 RepID=A0A2V1GVE7_9GAMM|nr:hypothetical protein [Pelagibaculum spongiae]PVZ68913.1 hypothetical protein DC094_11715 [Pelagibaculum spongiae]
MIKPYSTDFSISYLDQPLSNVFTLENSGEDERYIFSDDALQIGNTEHWVSALEAIEVEDSLLIATNTLTDEQAISTIQDLAARDIRVFILLGDSDENQPCLEALAGRCCIRTGVNQSGMLVIADHQMDQREWGKIYSSEFNSEHTFGYDVELEAKQVDDYYRLFCHLFWHKAQYEYLASGKPFPCKNAPIDMVDMGHQHVMAESLPGHLARSMESKGFYLSNINRLAENALWQLLDIAHLDLSQHQLLLSLEQIDSTKLKQFISKIDSIRLLEQAELPQILNSENDSWFLPLNNKIDSVSWSLKLTEDQKQSVENYLFDLHNSPSWQLNRDLTVDELGAPLRFSDAIETEIECAQELKINLDDLVCKNFYQFENMTAESLAEAKGLTEFKRTNLAKTIEYEITIHPPYLDSRSKDDSLHKHWQDTQAKWSIELERLRARLGRIEESKAGLAENIKRYMGGFLTGQLTNHRKLIKQLQDLESISLSDLSPSHRQEQVHVINEFVEKLSGTEEKLAEETDKAEQLKKWEEIKTKLEKECGNKYQQLETTDNKRNSFNSSKQLKIRTCQQELVSQWEGLVAAANGLENRDKLVDFNSSNVTDWHELNKSSIDQFFSAPDFSPSDQNLLIQWRNLLEQHKDHAAFIEAITDKELTAEAVRTWLDKPSISLKNTLKKSVQKLKTNDEKHIKDIENQHSQHIDKFKAALRKSCEDFLQKNKGLSREESQLEQQYGTAERSYKISKEKLDEHELAKSGISPKNSASILSKLFGKRAEVNNSYVHINFPNEDLPKVGQLYQLNKRRYLAIKPDENIDQGKECAERLKADLVVFRGSE